MEAGRQPSESSPPPVRRCAPKRFSRRRPSRRRTWPRRPSSEARDAWRFLLVSRSSFFVLSCSFFVLRGHEQRRTNNEERTTKNEQRRTNNEERTTKVADGSLISRCHPSRC